MNVTVFLQEKKIRFSIQIITKHSYLQRPSRRERLAALIANGSLLFRHHVVRVVLLPVLLHRLLRRVYVLAARKVTGVLYLVVRVLLINMQFQTVIFGE